MPEKKVATYTGDNGEHLMGVPATDLYESDWERLTDAQKADVHASSFYTVRGEAVKDAEAAAKRVEQAEPVTVPAQSVASMPEPDPEPKEAAKK